MRIDMFPRINIAGYEEFETIAGKRAGDIQEDLNTRRIAGGEFALNLGDIQAELVACAKNILKFVRPAPDEAQCTLAEKSFTFGAYLGVLLTQPEQPVLDTNSLCTVGGLDDIRLYINCAPREYLGNRPKICKLIDQNLLQPTSGTNQAKLARNMAGLAVMQCEEGRLEAFLHDQDLKLESELEKMGGVLPDDWR